MPSKLAHWGQVIGRTGEYVRKAMSQNRQILRPEMVQKHMTLHKFRRQEDIDRWTHGSDASNGGLSTSNLELAMDGVGARFHGNMSLRVKPEYEGMYRGGFAGIKTRTKKSLFGQINENLSAYSYLVLRARVGPPPTIRDAWYMNLRTANMSPTHVWQHRLFFRSQKQEFEELVLPLSDFGYTAAGSMIETSDEMLKESIEMMGISVLGGNAGLQGPYELVLDEIWATNDPFSPRQPR